ncbi:uncharacterized protein STEHIDRAFT_114717 [Stereum hirsutum FP-91666 SS1]|uniref:uncharacterized protein n=1 Tax=Stereum hirsutum (strain FP-91666) TaxID=721885 RepID=UPI000444A2D4|nr:uncharacterized protein STEHIDRAFT_114717 [Stereum hirsutum FP-91666 SS1]EIM82066.1 hypothetical protein STEHIDRAFT_114717 [Stereum hirsutum FP-91666 SS1]
MSSVAAFSFGTLGDFIVLLDLAQKVRKSLNASSGGSQDYLMLLIEVDALVRILRLATTPSTSTRLSQLSPALVWTACNALKSLQDVLNILETKVVTYQGKLRKGGSALMMMESWRKIGWGLLAQDDEVKKLRCQLSYHTRTIQVVMSFAQCAITDETERQSKRTLDRLTRYLPISIGYTWEGGATTDTAPIRLRDMYDHIFDVPLDLCATPELFDGMLRMYFHGRKGNRFIVKGDYELTTAGSSSLLSLIDPSEWQTTMKPGIVVEMNAIIPRKSRPNHHSNVECPCCRRIVPGVDIDVLTVCSHSDCRTSFTISRTDIDDPTNILDWEFCNAARPIIEATTDSNYIFGPEEWRTQHAQELEQVYAESRALRHVRVLDWLPIRFAKNVPRFKAGVPLTYRDSRKGEVPLTWKGTRTLSNVAIPISRCEVFELMVIHIQQGVVVHDVLSKDTGELLSLPFLDATHSIKCDLRPSAMLHNSQAMRKMAHRAVGMEENFNPSIE